MTDDQRYEISLIERLLAGREVTKSAKSASLLGRFDIAGWVVPSGRRNGWHIGTDAAFPLNRRLNQLWPTREHDLPLLYGVKMIPEKASALLHLPSLRRELAAVTGFINQHTWSTLFGAGPKKAAWRDAGELVVLTQDPMSRIKPNAGLEFTTGAQVLRLDHIASALTEVGIAQRAMLAGGKFGGRLPRLIVTIENLGAFVDTPAPDTVMLIYSPGFDLRAAEQIVQILPNIAWVHFGDLDPEGIQIWEALKRSTARPCQLHIPSFAFDYLDIAQKQEVPWGAIPAHPVLEMLKQQGKGIFQEAFVLDPRLATEWILVQRACDPQA